MQMCIFHKDASCQGLPTNPLRIDSVAYFPESLWDFSEHLSSSKVAAWCSLAIADKSQKLNMS